MTNNLSFYTFFINVIAFTSINNSIELYYFDLCQLLPKLCEYITIPALLCFSFIKYTGQISMICVRKISKNGFKLFPWFLIAIIILLNR